MWRSLLLIVIACGSTPTPVKPSPDAADRGSEPRRLLRYPTDAASGTVRVHREWTEQHTDSHRPDRNSGLQLAPYVADSFGRYQLVEGGAIEVVIERETGEAVGPYPWTLRYRCTPLAFEQAWQPLNDPRHMLPYVLPARWPDAAVGAGARWEETSVGGARRVWEVVAIDGDRVSLRGTTSHDHVDARSRSSSSAKVELTIDLQRFRLEASRTAQSSGGGTHSLGTTTFSMSERATITIE